MLYICKGVHSMYPSLGHLYNSQPYVSPPFYEESLYYPSYDERQFGQLFPPMGGPPGVPGPPPSIAPPGQGVGGGAPTSPPPAFVPAQTQQAGAFAVDPGSIRRCLFRYTYVWLSGNQQFWFYPIFLGRTSVAGYRWTGFRWIYFGISLRQIQSFTCV
mgnify:CR=1 FL=1